jgi:hypothetical protein
LNELGGIPLAASRFLLRKNKPSVMTTARKRRAPMTVPAMAAIEMPFEGVEVELVGGFELAVDEGAVCEAPGGDCVEDGDRPVRQLLSSEKPTILTSELPP